MQRRFVLLFACTTVVLAAFPAVGSATFIPGPNGKIVFASGRSNSEFPAIAANDDTKARIWVVDYPFGTPVQLTTKPEGVIQHRHPNWSPDHSKVVYAAGVAFSGEYALWIADLKTEIQTEFVAKAATQDRPSWSPDGSRIAYGSGGDIYVKDVSNTNVNDKGTQLTKTADIDERPVWSPDGNTLYFNRGPAADRDLYKLTPVAATNNATGILTAATIDWQPAVSPDGKRLCYLQGPQTNAAKLRTIGVDGLGDTPFTGDGVTGALNCVWSPDGTRILYTAGAFEGGEIRSRDINGGDLNNHTGFNVASHFDGNSDWATNFSPTCVTKNASVGVNGFVSILLSCTDPDSGFGIEPPTPDPLGDSSMEIVTPPKNGTLGSLENGKVIYTPKKDFKGTDSFTYTGEDDASTSKPATVTIQVANPPSGGDSTPPSISNIKVSAMKWRLGTKLASISDLALISKAPIGTTISFDLSEAAQATLSFQRAAPGRKVGRSCVKRTPQNAAKKPCTRYLNAGALGALSAKAGQNKVRFQGRLSGSRSLRLGKHRVVVRARDAAGNQSQPRTGPSFTIVKK
jgi:Bacterial Ig domain/WD40-like Beta Propeller Repeat